MKRALGNILLLGLTLLFMFGVGEIASRVICAKLWKGKIVEIYRYSQDRKIFYELRPGWQGIFGDVPVAINAFGMRDIERPLKKRAGTFRVLGVGDSCTFGWKIPLEQIYLKQLEAQWNALHPSQPVEVLNAGVPGYNALQETQYLQKAVDRLKPDLVTIGFWVNDITDYDGKPVRVLPQINPRKRAHRWQEAVRWSFFYQFLALRLDLLKDKFAYGFFPVGLNDADDILRDHRDSVVVEEHWRVYFQCMDRVAEMARVKKIPVVLVIVPHLKQMELGPEWAGMQERLKRYAQEKGIGVADLLPEYRQSPEFPLIDREDLHPNAAGHRLIAQKLLKVIETLK